MATFTLWLVLSKFGRSGITMAVQALLAGTNDERSDVINVAGHRLSTGALEEVRS